MYILTAVNIEHLSAVVVEVPPTIQKVLVDMDYHLSSPKL